jgi:protein-disulfide isomerase
MFKLVWRNLDFGGEQLNPGDSPAAARFAAAAGMQNKLWQFVDLFYKNQQDESTRYVSDAFLKRLGSAVPGLDVQKAFTDRQSSAANAQLDEAKKLFAGFGFTGTPSFLLGGPGRTLSPLNVTSFDVSQFSGPIDSLLGKG